MNSPANQQEQDALSLSDKVLRGIFGRTASEQDEFVANLADHPAWELTDAMVDRAAEMAQEGATHVVPCLRYGQTPGAVVVQLGYSEIRILLAVHGCWESRAETLDAWTPPQGSWAAWKAEVRAEEAAQAEAEKKAAREAAKAKADAEKSAQAAERAAVESQKNRVNWFYKAFTSAVYALWGEEFLTAAEKDALLEVFDTKGKLRTAAEAARATRDSVMASCQVPAEVGEYQEPTDQEVAVVADVVAAWVNGDLDGLKNPLK